ncbi:hypothetical protein [Runella sp. SP2]|uniref:hypothetical protein n=1 Tax=Runella sp. SP2 TaxID=2268026 RepID=UPI0013DE5006|nr:hypothetical protein [Runella sp. SP2]
MATEQEKLKEVEKKVPKQLFIFQGVEYDLSNLTKQQKEYLAKFPDEVPYIK